MSVEVLDRPSTPNEYKNVFRLEERFGFQRKLVLYDQMISNHNNPKIQFSMSNEYLQNCLETREALCIQLGLPPEEDKRKKAISYFKRKSIQKGHPYWQR